MARRLVNLIEVEVGQRFYGEHASGEVVWKIDKGSSKAVEVRFDGMVTTMHIAPSLQVWVDEVEPAPVTVAPVVVVAPAPVTVAPVVVAPAPVAPVAPVAPAPVTVAPVTVAPVTVAPVVVTPVAPAPVTVAPVVSATVAPAPVAVAPVVVALPMVSLPKVSVPVAPVSAKPVVAATAPTLGTANRPTVKDFLLDGVRRGLSPQDHYKEAQALFPDSAIGQSFDSFKNQRGVYKSRFKHLL